MPPLPFDLAQILGGFGLPGLPPFDPAEFFGSVQQGSTAVTAGSSGMASGSATGSLIPLGGSAALSVAPLLLPVLGGILGGS